VSAEHARENTPASFDRRSHQREPQKLKQQDKDREFQRAIEEWKAFANGLQI
jgi:hypothetical protein